MATDNDFDKVRARLAEILKKKELSMRSVSLEAGLGQSYLSGILKEGKEPTVPKLMAICDALGVSLLYVLHGVEISKQAEELIALLDEKPERRDAALQLLRAP